MAEQICRVLRDGVLEGEHAPAVSILDSILFPFGHHVFDHMLIQLSSQILAGKSQSRGIVVVAFSRSPSFYINLLKSRTLDLVSSNKWIWILDCYTDPLGWKDQHLPSGKMRSLSKEASCVFSIFKDVRDLEKLFTGIIELGREFVGQGKRHFSVAIDSVTEMLRYASTSLVAGLLTNLRGHDQVSSTFWLLHTDLHESRDVAALEYMSTTVATLGPLHHLTNGQKTNIESLSLFEQKSGRGKFHVRFKRRNGRVRVMCDEFHVEQSRIKFTSISADGGINHGLVPKVQFNLHLSEKEKNEKDKVVLPFEHQGNGRPINIYDGRKSVTESKEETAPISLIRKLPQKDDGTTSTSSSKGEIIYYRDSEEEEMPDSDEDPDDDLDI